MPSELEYPPNISLFIPNPVNGHSETLIPPNTSFYLRDGSTIKIGEVTIIVVNFIHPEDRSSEVGGGGNEEDVLERVGG